MARSERRIHGLARIATNHIENLLGVKDLRTPGSQTTHNTRGGATVIGKVAILQRTCGCVHDKARNPRAVGSTTLWAAPIRKWSAGEHHFGKLVVLDATGPLEHVKHHAARRQFIRKSHDLLLLAIRTRRC